ncbi:MAG: ParB/RepB/Spo0J family partition protein [Deltaproteobacteria bacterium]|nr:ParB/RepB/Spo0J family partition protein [Deltaproteobacteria bacterium]
MAKKAALGKGIGALLESSGEEESQKFFVCPIEDLRPGKNQPRKHFDDQRLLELSASIREKGIIQPLVVRKKEGFFEIIAGERRWRAAQKAGLHEVPVILENMSEASALEIALIENLQREDLNPIEEAEAYKELIENFNISQEEVAKKVGKERSTVTNALRLLKLPLEIRADVASGFLSMGHARALLALEMEEDILEARDEIIRKGMSVRETEGLIKRLRKHTSGLARKRTKSLDPEILDLTDQLKQALGTQVKITPGSKGGRIEISYFSDQDFERLLGILGV